MTREAAAILVDKCIAEVRERLVTAPTKYHVKIVDENGISCEVSTGRESRGAGGCGFAKVGFFDPRTIRATPV